MESAKKYVKKYQWHNVYNVDFLTAARSLPPNVIDTTIIHPPSIADVELAERDFFKYNRWCRSWVNQINYMSKPNATAWIIGNNDTLLMISYLLMELGWYTLNIIRLYNPSKNASALKRSWDTKKGTFCIWMAKGKWYYFDYEYVREEWSSIKRNNWFVYQLRDSEVKYGEHPEQLSDMLVDWMIQTSTPKEGGVLDPFMGSGTTGAVCERARINWIGFENDKQWYNVSLKRLLDVKLNMMA
jgi:DNA modification methylase